MNPDKTLCKQCDNCEEYNYQRTITRGKRKGELFKFKYCNGNKDIVGKSDWGPDSSVSTGKTYATPTSRLKGHHHFESFLKKDPKNVVLHLGDTLDLRMKTLREVSKTCRSQAQAHGESIFPGVSKVNYYKNHPDDASKKIWMARFKTDNLKEKMIGTFYTELEAADAYYTYSENHDRDINRETIAYKTYQNWLIIKEATDQFKNSVLKLYNDLPYDAENELKWASQLLKVELENKNKEKYNQRKYEWKSL
jgi:hypothetical protein